MRLRQIALLARALEPVCDDILAVLGLGVPYDDPGVGKYGLRNAVFPVGDTFLEVVCPKAPGTTAGRLLERRAGDGGYMVILQVEDLAAARRQAVAQGVRIADQFDGEGVAFTHLHPKDVGGAIVSLDHMEPAGRWEWGGPGWRDRVLTSTSLRICGAEIQSETPGALAARWAEVLGLPLGGAPEAPRLDLEGDEIRFVAARDGRGEGLGGFDVQVRDPGAVRARAAARGLVDASGGVVLAGTRVGLLPAS